MDQSNALNRLLEASDLVKMMEELIAPGNYERLSPSSLSGARITLRTLRDSILASHDALAGELVTRSKGRLDAQLTSTAQEQPLVVRNDSPGVSRTTIVQTDIERIGAIKKRDLRSSLETLIDRSQSTVE